MKKTVKAQINWIPIEDGGRKNILPVGMRYCPVIVFEIEQSGETLWSAEIYNTSIEERKPSSRSAFYVAQNRTRHYLLKVGGNSACGRGCLSEKKKR